MKRIYPVCLLMILLLGTPAFAQFSSGPVLETKQALAKINANGNLEVVEVIAMPVCESHQATRTVTVHVPETRTKVETLVQNGQQVQVEKAYTVAVPETRTETYMQRVCKLITEQKHHSFLRNPQNGSFLREIDGSSVTLFEIDGTSIEPSQLRERLKSWTLVLVTHNGQMAAEHYSTLFKSGTLVIAIPAPLPGLSMPTMPPPSPDSNRPPTAPQTNADSGSKYNKGIPPMFAFSRVSSDSFIVRFDTDVTESSFLLNTFTETINGKPVRKEIRLPTEHTNRNSQIWKIPVSAVRGWSGDGNELSLEELSLKLKVEIPILVTFGRREVDPFWMRNLKPEAVVLSTPLLDDAALAPQPKQPVLPVGQASRLDGDSKPTLTYLSPSETEVLALTNRERTKLGLNPFTVSERLCHAAHQHAIRMAELATLNHTLDGKTFDQRIAATGYRSISAGENISDAFDAASSIDIWMKSAGHRQNILSRDYTEIGVGVAKSRSGRSYWVQVFASPAI